MENPSQPNDVRCGSEDIIEQGMELFAEGLSAYDRLEDATEAELFAQLRTSDAYIDFEDYDPEDVTLYAAAIFHLKDRGYTVHTEDSVLYITDDETDTDEVVYEEEYRENEFITANNSHVESESA